MGFTPLVDEWNASRQERTRLEPGRRWHQMEVALGDGRRLVDMTPNRHHWRYRERLGPPRSEAVVDDEGPAEPEARVDDVDAEPDDDEEPA